MNFVFSFGVLIIFLYHGYVKSEETCPKSTEAGIRCNTCPKKWQLNGKKSDVIVLTVASEKTEGYLRYIRSANYYNIEVETLGMYDEWLGGPIEIHGGGGYKINLLRDALEPYRNDDNKIIIFTDSYDVIFTTNIEVIVHKFQKFGSRILFGAERFLWPDKTLDHLYPVVSKHLPKYLNSGLFMGYASDIFEILNVPIKNMEDDQLYFTRAFLHANNHNKLKIKLDYESEIFQNLNGVSEDVRVMYNNDTGEYFVKNIQTGSVPSLIHGNGRSKIILNNFGSYVAGAFKHNECQLCQENKLKISTQNAESLPRVTVAIIIPKTTPFLEEFLDSIYALDYPKDKLHLFIYNNVEYHHDVVEAFIEEYESSYLSVKHIKYSDSYKESIGRNWAVSYAERMGSDYLFVVSAEAHIDNPLTLIRLIEQNRNVISPMMTRSESTWSNFWGTLSEKGFYARSHDYMKIVKYEIRGLWNVPFVSSSYLIKRAVFPKITYADDILDADMAFCQHLRLRAQQIFMYTMNVEHYGHLVNNEDFNPMLKQPEFYQLLSNQIDWENRYLHRDYFEQLKSNQNYKQPCPDVYSFPIANDQFCDDLVRIVESFAKWSDRKNEDELLADGHKVVRHIHMSQVGLEAVWLKFLRKYVRPLQEAAYSVYYKIPPKSIMNFVARHRPNEQPIVRQFNDSSTYVIHIALNSNGTDYEGGGCDFLRYNCSVTSTQKGWMLMHPGRLTHYYEELRTIKGTRYVMTSFVDP